MKTKPNGEKKCFFCNATKNLERHHIFQLRFRKYYSGNINDPENLVWLCPIHHKLYHQLTDVMLDQLVPHLKRPRKSK